MKETCRLCLSKDVEILSAGERALIRCSDCLLVFSEKENILTPRKEKARYEFHKNSIDDPGYVGFLTQLLDPVLHFVPSDARVLDYGSGPEPVLAELLHRAGYSVDIYDPYFAPTEPEVTYGAITLSEVAEHFAEPRKEFERLRSLLEPGGILGIMTLRYSEDTDFSSWHYARDETHVAFYADDTFRWIESHFGFERVYDDERVLLLKKG